MLNEEIEIVPYNPTIQPIQPVSHVTVTNFFTEGAIMFLRKVPMNSYFLSGNQTFKRVGTDRVQNENGDIITMSKNTVCELLKDMEDDIPEDDIPEDVEDDIEDDVEDSIEDDIEDDIDEDEIYSGN